MIVHLAGDQISFSGHERQRCAWCGAVLIDRDPSRAMILVDPDDLQPDLSLPWWQPGAFVARDGDQMGSAAWVVEPEPSEIAGSIKAPAESCLRMPPEATL